ncbi:MAG TPA: hypothetical protein VLD67_00760, partial [Vicinamibacterales bacterium]|nr:hypothetical protein [Vicinamibacterales bacterium]
MISLADPIGFRGEHREQSGPPAEQPGQGEVNRADPCVLVPDSPGEANGIEEHCTQGASGGV